MAEFDDYPLPVQLMSQQSLLVKSCMGISQKRNLSVEDSMAMMIEAMVPAHNRLAELCSSFVKEPPNLIVSLPRPAPSKKKRKGT